MYFLFPREFNFSVFLFLAWVLLVFSSSMALPYLVGPNMLDTAHSFLLVATYGFMYLIPTIIICCALSSWHKIRIITTTAMFLITVVSVFINGRLHDLYGFHFNGFVWNLMITPGGFSSLGADQISSVSVAGYVTVLISFLAICLYGGRSVKVTFHLKYALVLFIAATASERIIYGFSYAKLYGPIMTQSSRMIFYQPLKMNTLLTRVGYAVKRGDKNISIDDHSGENINYPISDIHIDRIDRPYNIIFLVAESMRSKDIFTERVMPHSVEFARDYAINFTHHYSGGNGTREGLFAMFYGLYGSYWNSFLRARKSPVLFDVLNSYGYEYFTYTAARFTYPEFDKTIFGSVPAKNLIETIGGEPWFRDKNNVTMLIDDIENRDTSKPFMGFVFFESTHARYSFPEDSIIEEDYLKSLDYVGLTREDIRPIIGGMKSRYINASHFVDSQFKRVYDYLVHKSLLENTIVIVTGDHGEEFMEKSRWGHNSSFVEEQVRVPMLVSFPGRKAGVVTGMTSHLDVSSTILQALGVSNPVTDYTLGKNLFDNENREMVVVASWSDLGLITEKGKLVIPFKGTTQHRYLATTKADTPIDLSDLIAALSEEIGRVVTNSRRFIRTPRISRSMAANQAVIATLNSRVDSLGGNEDRRL